MTSGCTSFTTSHRVVYRVHDNSAVVRPAAEPAAAACLSGRLQIVVTIGNHTYSGTAGRKHHSGLARREAENSVVTFTRGELGVSTRGTGHCRTLSRAELDGVYVGSNWNFAERKSVAYLRSDAGAGLYDLADLDALRGDDIPFLAVRILYQSDAGAAVRIILDSLYGSLDIVLVAQEIVDTVHSLVTAADIAHCHLAGVVASAGSLERNEKRFLRLFGGNLVKSADGHLPCTRSTRFEFSDCHDLLPP